MVQSPDLDCGTKRVEMIVQLLMFLFLIHGPVRTLEAEIPEVSLFTNIACGAPSNLSLNGLTYVPDNLDVGNASSIREPVLGGSQFLRYFPFLPGRRNLFCYGLNLTTGKTLVRATFQYGNYDLMEKPPAFQVFVRNTPVASVNLSLYDLIVEEVVVDGPANQLPFCLLGIPGRAPPVISLLETRPVPVSSYKTDNTSVILRGVYRINCGNAGTSLRYPDDMFDRIWGIDQGWGPDVANPTVAIDSNQSINLTQVASPLSVMQSARKLVGLGRLSYSLRLSSEFSDHHVTGYFANLENGTAPIFNVTANGNVYAAGSRVAPVFVASQQSFTVPASDWLNYTLVGLRGSPFLNALEIYEIMSMGPQTSVQDAEALQILRQSFDSISDWDAWDPCLPSPWQGVFCSPGIEPQVTELRLAGLLPKPVNLYVVGELSALEILELQNNALSSSQLHLSPLTNLVELNLSYNSLTTVPALSKEMIIETLDLQHNRITGSIPDSLKELPNLRKLNLANNNFSGAIPDWIISSDLIVDLSGNPCLGVDKCGHASGSSPHSSKSSKMGAVIIGASVGGGILLLVVVAGLTVVCWRKRKPAKRDIAHSVEKSDIRQWSAAKRFTLRQLSSATQNFKNVVGEGGFGPVYFGALPGGQEIAVKLRADKSRIGVSAFGNEVDLLSRVHHRNLVTLVGFCDEAGKQCLVYEYVPNGTLADHLYGVESRTRPLDFKTRLRIAVGAATGIEYLHTNCNPMIIHRDIKTTNILLDNKLEAKVSDFGLSKVVVDSGATHVTTAVKGTAGYLDPEYYVTQQLTEKSDVYSFGVVLLELLCARKPFASNLPPDEYSLVAWAVPYLRAKAYSAVLDPTLEGLANPISLEMVASLAVRALERLPANRPKMTEVLHDLKAALLAEEYGRDSGEGLVASASPEIARPLYYQGGPQAR